MRYKGLFVGLTTIDIQYFVVDFPERNTKVKTQTPDILVGGPATNAAVAFSYLNKGANLATAVGHNSFTSFIENDFKEVSIDFCDLVKTQNINPVVASVVTSENGDRNIFTHNPSKIQAEITAKNLFDALQPQVVMLDGFYPEFSIECAKVAKAKNIPVVIDGGSWKPQYHELLKYTDFTICSADFYPPNCSNSEDVFHYLNAQGVVNSAISRGENSILYQQGKNRGEIAVESISATDTLGAGDFLHGAFCFYYLECGCFIEALNKASKLASQSCLYTGTREWIKY